jgi:hypothetical protein
MALAVEQDEAFNPIDEGVLCPDGVVFRTNASETGRRRGNLGEGHRNVLGVVLGPIFEDESVDYGTVYAG